MPITAPLIWPYLYLNITQAHPFLLWWLWEYVYFILLSSSNSNSNSEAWPVCHCLGLGRETMACIVWLFIFLCNGIFHKLNFDVGFKQAWALTIFMEIYHGVSPPPSVYVADAYVICNEVEAVIVMINLEYKPSRLIWHISSKTIVLHHVSKCLFCWALLSTSLQTMVLLGNRKQITDSHSGSRINRYPIFTNRVTVYHTDRFI